MLIRIVRMTFKEDKVPEFLALFNTVKKDIRNFQGCEHLELWKDSDHPNIFITFSKWEDAAALKRYRNSELFEGTWKKTKSFFEDDPLAFSSEHVMAVKKDIV